MLKQYVKVICPKCGKVHKIHNWLTFSCKCGTSLVFNVNNANWVYNKTTIATVDSFTLRKLEKVMLKNFYKKTKILSKSTRGWLLSQVDKLYEVECGR